MKLIDRLLQLLGRRPHNPALDKEFQQAWKDSRYPMRAAIPYQDQTNALSDPEYRRRLDKSLAESLRPMRPGEIIDQAYAQLSEQQVRMPTKGEGDLAILNALMGDGAALQSASHPAGAPVPEDADFSPGSVMETEIDLPDPYVWHDLEDLLKRVRASEHLKPRRGNAPVPAAAPEGMKRHWTNDIGPRRGQFLKLGWREVTDANGYPVMRRAGTNRGESPIWSYLLEAPTGTPHP